MLLASCQLHNWVSSLPDRTSGQSMCSATQLANPHRWPSSVHSTNLHWHHYPIRRHFARLALFLQYSKPFYRWLVVLLTIPVLVSYPCRWMEADSRSRQPLWDQKIKGYQECWQNSICFSEQYTRLLLIPSWSCAMANCHHKKRQIEHSVVFIQVKSDLIICLPRCEEVCTSLFLL